MRASRVGLRRSRKCAVGWVELRLVAARPTTRAGAIGGPHDAEHRSTHPTADCGSAALGLFLLNLRSLGVCIVPPFGDDLAERPDDVGPVGRSKRRSDHVRPEALRAWTEWEDRSSSIGLHV